MPDSPPQHETLETLRHQINLRVLRGLSPLSQQAVITLTRQPDLAATLPLTREWRNLLTQCQMVWISHLRAEGLHTVSVPPLEPTLQLLAGEHLGAVLPDQWLWPALYALHLQAEAARMELGGARPRSHHHPDPTRPVTLGPEHLTGLKALNLGPLTPGVAALMCAEQQRRLLLTPPQSDLDWRVQAVVRASLRARLMRHDRLALHLAWPRPGHPASELGGEDSEISWPALDALGPLPRPRWPRREQATLRRDTLPITEAWNIVGPRHDRLSGRARELSVRQGQVLRLLRDELAALPVPRLPGGEPTPLGLLWAALNLSRAGRWQLLTGDAARRETLRRTMSVLVTGPAWHHPELQRRPRHLLAWHLLARDLAGMDAASATTAEAEST